MECHGQLLSTRIIQYVTPAHLLPPEPTVETTTYKKGTPEYDKALAELEEVVPTPEPFDEPAPNESVPISRSSP